MAKEKSCFIIMPITVSEPWLEIYRDKENHFNHVLECLFIPAVEIAGYKPIPPKAGGSEVIQATIVENLENSDLVLCDMSILNANVFFEFGIRTALNKPVCVVRDEFIKLPFDTGVIPCPEYKSALESWEIESEINKLAKHIQDAAKSEGTTNSLWKRFAFKLKSQLPEVGTGENAEHEQILLGIQSLALRLDQLQQQLERDLQLKPNPEDSPIIKALKQCMDHSKVEDSPIMEALKHMEHLKPPPSK